MENGEKLMTTSCCPAYFRAAQVHIPEIQPYVSHTKTPMYYTAELVKKNIPTALPSSSAPAWPNASKPNTIRTSTMF